MTQSFLTLTKSPLLWQEVRRLLRSAKSFWFLFGFLGVLLYVVMQSWAEFTRAFAPDGNIARGSRFLFYQLAQGHLMFLAVFTPFLMAPSIVFERESQTFPLLVSSPISLLHLIVAKLLSPLIFVFLLLISGIPVLSLSFIGGGLSFNEVIATYGVLLFAAITFGLLGLFCSTLRGRIYEVYLIASAATLVFVLLLPFHGTVWNYINSQRMLHVTEINHGFHYLSPFFALQEVLFPTSGSRVNVLKIFNPFLSNQDPMLAISGHLVIYLLVSLFFCLLLLAAIIYRIRQIAYEAGSERPLDYRMKQFAIWLQQHPWQVRFIYGALASYFLFQILSHIEDGWHVLQQVLWLFILYFLLKAIEYLGGEDPPPPSPSDDDGGPNRDYEITFPSDSGNPGLFLERRVQWFARSAVLLRLTYVALMISILMLPLVSYNGSWLYLTLPFIAAAFFTLPLAATSVSADRERGTLDLLRTTLLSTGQIIHAKFATNLQYSFLMAIALYIPGLLILSFFTLFSDYELDLVYKLSDLLILFWYPLVLFSALVLYTAIGIFCSVYCRRTNHALLFSALLIIVCLLAPSPITAFNVVNLTWSGGFGIGLSVFSPIAIIVLLFPEGRINLLEQTLDIPATLSQASWGIAILQCGISLAAAHLLYRVSVKILKEN